MIGSTKNIVGIESIGKNVLKACLVVVVVFDFTYVKAVTPDKPIKKVAHLEKKANTKTGETNEADTIPHLNEWEPISYHADFLIEEGKYKEAEAMLTSILPQAKKDAPFSIEYALALYRLARDLSAMKQYPKALARVQEAFTVLNHIPPGLRQRKVMYRCLQGKAAILLGMQKNTEAEMLARKVLAYSIAFPEIANARQTEVSYMILHSALEAQNKTQEAKKVSEIMK